MTSCSARPTNSEQQERKRSVKHQTGWDYTASSGLTMVSSNSLVFSIVRGSSLGGA
jgi:hypothetical protein